MPPDAAPRVVEQRRRRVPARRRERIAEGGPARRRPAREGEARLERVEGRRAGREDRLAYSKLLHTAHSPLLYSCAVGVRVGNSLGCAFLL